MKKLKLTFLTVILGFTLHGQNLISNWNFQYNDLEMNCEGWFNPCGEELTVYCSEDYDCLVGIYNESPSAIPEDVWSLKVAAGFPEEGYAETYITGQNGTYVYQFSCWKKAINSTWTGEAILGTGAQNQFVASKSVFSSENTWSELTFIDTLTTSIEDTITVRLRAGVGDFCTCQSAFDFIELTVMDSIVLTDIEESLDENRSRAFPNPARDFITIEIIEPHSGSNICTVYSNAGVVVETIESTNDRWEVDISGYSSGMYFYQIQRKENLFTTAKGKFVVE